MWKQQNQWIQPVLNNVRYRVQARLLPLSHYNDNLCGCRNQQDDAFKHLFWACPKVRPIWQHLRHHWQELLPRLEWASIILDRTIQVSPNWRIYKPVILFLWRVVSASTLHHIWTARNAHVFDQQPWPDIRLSLIEIRNSIALHIKYYRYRTLPTAVNKTHLQDVLDHINHSSSWLLPVVLSRQ